MGDAPELSPVDEQGDLTVLQWEPPESLRAKFEVAAACCLTGAITIVD